MSQESRKRKTVYISLEKSTSPSKKQCLNNYRNNNNIGMSKSQIILYLAHFEFRFYQTTLQMKVIKQKMNHRTTLTLKYN